MYTTVTNYKGAVIAVNNQNPKLYRWTGRIARKGNLLEGESTTLRGAKMQISNAIRKEGEFVEGYFE